MLAGAQNASTFGTKHDVPKLGPALNKNDKVTYGDHALPSSQVNLGSSLEGHSGVKFEESPDKGGAAPNVYGRRDRTSEESLLHQASGKFGGSGAQPLAPIDFGAPQQNEASRFSKPNFSSINSNA